MNFSMLLKIRNMGTFVAFISGLALLSISPRSGEAATLPELPRVFMNTAYSPPTGNIITVNAGGNFQAALNSAALGDTIVLQAGATFVGPFTLPNKTSGSGWIYIRSSAYANLPPPGSRVSPFYAANMPKIVVGANTGPAIATVNNSHHFRFVGIEFKPVGADFIFSLIEMGNGNTSNTTVPDNLIFDRCYVHGSSSATNSGRRGFLFVGTNLAVIDSHVSGFYDDGSDSQAIEVYQGNGPFKIVNNYLEAASENINFGGIDPSIPNSVPSDAEIRHNHFFKPLSWIGAGHNVKNLLEFKNAQRVLVQGNVFENNWLDGQSGFSILITPRNQSGGCPWCITQDITIRLNKLINLGAGFNIAGDDDIQPSQRTRRVLIENNIIEVTGLRDADNRIFQLLRGAVDITIRHNTGILFAGGAFGLAVNVPKSDQFDFRDNLLANGSYGFFGQGTDQGIPTLNAYFTNYTFTNNAIIGPFSGGTCCYPPNTFFPINPAAVGFVNFAGGNYTLSSGSAFRNAASDGKDLGADIAAVVAAGGGGLVSGVPAPSNAR